MGEDTTLMVARCLDRLKLGDDRARADLLRHAGNRLTRLAEKLALEFSSLRRWVGPDDALQNALLRLHRALEAVPPETPREFFRLAALQIRRELLDLARHYRGPLGAAANHDSLPGGQSPCAADAPSSSDPARLAQWTEFHARLELLPDEEREVIDLLWYHELGQEEAAELLGLSLRTLKRRWQKARLRLHEVLSGTQ